MTDGEWTPARGYTMAACHLVVRSGIITGLSVLAGVGFVKACTAMGLHRISWPVPSAAGVAVGVVEGYVLARHVADKCGLSGRSLIMPALVLLGGAQFLAYHVTMAIHPRWDDVTLLLFLMAFMFAMLIAVKNFVLDG